MTISSFATRPSGLTTTVHCTVHDSEVGTASLQNTTANTRMAMNTTGNSSFAVNFLAEHLEVDSACLWPPSADSAPFLVSLWLILATSLYIISFRERSSADYESVKSKRRESKLKALINLVTMEELRLANAADDGDKAGKLKECIGDEPPTAKHIYSIIFEEVEEEPAYVAVGFSATNPWYLRAVALFKHRVRLEISEAIEQTVAVQDVHSKRDALIGDHIAQDYSDGEKLVEILEFTRDKAEKYFAKHQVEAVPDDALGVPYFDESYLGNERTVGFGTPEHHRVTERARSVLSEVRAAHRNSLLYIMDLLWPVLPTYLGAILCMLCARAFEAPLWASALPSYKAAIAMINPDAKPGEFGYGPDVLSDAKSHALLFCVGFLFSRPIEMLASSLGDKAAEEFSHPLRKAVMGAIMRQDTEYFDSHPSGVLQERLNRDTNQLVENMLWLPRRMIEFTFRVFQRMITLYFIAPRMLSACLWFNVPMFSLVVLSTSPVLHHLYRQRERTNEIAAAETLELLQKMKTVRQFSMECSEQDKYAVGNVGRGIFEGRIHALESFTHTLRHTCHIAGEVYVIYVALTLAVSGEARVTDAVVASTVGMWLQHDFKNTLEQIPKLLKVMEPLRRVASLLACKPRIERTEASPKAKTLLRPERFVGNIEFRSVTFSYPTERQKRVLGGLTFSAHAGQKVAFVGKSNCGKSTAMDLLQRFYSSTGGEILIDGRKIEEYDAHHLRRHCGIVAQENTLFNRTIYENIVYGMQDPPGPDSEDFMDVCRKAQVWDFVRRFPSKQHTYLGENKGVKLSVGQKQRIASEFARVMMRKPTFLLLDEATSALDAINEKAVQIALDEMLVQHRGVALVVAHRLTTICNCDKIVVMGDDGTKIEEGTHAELLKVPKQVDPETGEALVGSGLYHTLWDTQQLVGTSGDDHQLEDTLRTKLDRSSSEVERLKEKVKSLESRLGQT